MGLDMYLKRKIYVKNWGFEPENHVEITVIRKSTGKPDPRIHTDKIVYIEEEAGYWRKANAIHRWFVEHVQEGQDDCQTSYVSQENLQELLDTCILVRNGSKLKSGTVNNGYSFTPQGDEIPIQENGKVIEDPSVAEDLLPTESGFFFGSTDYDEYYYEDIEDTIEILQDILTNDVDDKGNLIGEYYYRASW